LAVHPAYWRKGHGTELLEWSKSLSDMDNVPQCVLNAEALDRNIYIKRGFRDIGIAHEYPQAESADAVTTKLFEYLPKS